MTVQTKYCVGLTIPLRVRTLLPSSLVEKLSTDGHGISFPGGRIVQMRYIHLGNNMGNSYALSNHNNSWQKAIEAAMKDNQGLRISHPNSCRVLSPDRGVRFVERLRKGHEIFTYHWSLHYTVDGKNKFKAFYCGNENTMDAARKRHAQLTAWHFRRLYCETGDHEVFSAENTAGWQHKQFYSDELKDVVPPHKKKKRTV